MEIYGDCSTVVHAASVSARKRGPFDAGQGFVGWSLCGGHRGRWHATQWQGHRSSLWELPPPSAPMRSHEIPWDPMRSHDISWSPDPISQYFSSNLWISHFWRKCHVQQSVQLACAILEACRDSCIRGIRAPTGFPGLCLAPLQDKAENA